MFRSSFFTRLSRRLIADRRGTIGVVFGLMLVPTAIALGAGVDFARGLQLKQQLQSAADSAALAGAATYTGPTQSSAATTVSDNYMNAAIPKLAANTGVTYTVTPSAVSGGSSSTAYAVTVSAHATLKPTLLGLFVTSIPVTVTSEAENPVVNATFDMGNFYSNAGDLNTVYYYVVPSDGSLPQQSALVQIATNGSTPCGTGTGIGSPMTIQISASQKVGFALKNVTGGKCNYGNNGYGAAPGSVHYFYSQNWPPSQGVYSSVTTDRSLQIVSAPSQGYIANPPTGQFTSQSQAYAVGTGAPSCSQLLGKAYLFAWNDMGGNPDDEDYNDMEYTFSCSAPNSNTGVVLVK